MTLKYSLRTVFVVIGFAAIACGILAVWGRPYLRKYQTEKKWMDRGAYAKCNEDGQLTGFYAGHSNFDLSALRELAGSHDLGYLFLTDHPVKDDDLKMIRDLPNLYSLALNGTEISDAAIAFVADEFPALKYLMLENTKITDRCINDLAKLSNLKQLVIEGTQISANGVKQLQSKIPNTEILCNFVP